jgi:hypothetical protein
MREGGVKVASYFRFTVKKEKKSEAYYICVYRKFLSPLEVEGLDSGGK